MKKLSIFFGYLAVVLIALFAWFKLQHWPGAAVLLLAGCIVFCLGFLPLWFLVRYKQAVSILGKLIVFAAFLTMFMFGFTLLAKSYHWFFAIGLSCAGYSLLIITIILSVIQAFKDPDEVRSLTGHTFSIASALVLTIWVFLELITIPRGMFREFLGVIETQNKEIGYFTEKSNSMFANFDQGAAVNPQAQAYMEKAVQVNAATDSLIAYLKSAGEDLMFMADDEVIPWDSVQNLCNLTDTKAACRYFCDPAKDSLYHLKYAQYREFMKENTNSRGQEMLDLFFPDMEADSASSCGTDEDCCAYTVTSSLIWINAEILHARMLQAETMNYLQAMYARALNRVSEEKESTPQP
ncbi:MAG TPA: hypothetical protein P5531_06880 [Bacteroidales bacterium]|nr:hypothetical protein [Bacteroidales bacterium]HSA44516.1 hypothetical protein [Bacteroidales bacterium]